MRHELLATLLALSLLLGAATPAGAAVAWGSEQNSNAQVAQPGGSVNVTVGQQLSTVMAETDGDVRTEVEDTAFEVRFEARSDDERAEAIEERAEELARRAIAIREDYENATRAHEAGEISDSEYAERIATLNARADDLAESVRKLRGRAAGVSALELRAAGHTAADLRAIDERLDAVTGTGAKALLQRFTGRSTGEVRIETGSGLSIEVEGEDGELSREIERHRDDDHDITVAQTDALSTARSELGTPDEGRWALEKASVHEDSGYYEFEFVLVGANATGEAEIRVDGSSGDVFRLETEIEAPERDDDEDERDEADDRDEDERDHDEDDLALLVAEGTPRPNETVTLLALAEGEPVAGATVTLDDREIGTTDANGTIDVTLPAGEVELEVRSGDAEGELEFEFDEAEREDEELRRHFDVRGTIDGDTVTVHVAYDGEPVTGATVSVDGREVGTTDADGTVTFEADLADGDDLEVDVRKGAFEAELKFETRDGSLAHVDTEIDHEDEVREEEDDREDDEREDDEADHEDEEETESDEERTESDDGDDERTETDEDAGELDIRIVDGARERGATVTVAVTVGGEAAADVPVFLNDEHVGDTDASGRLDVTLPDEGDRVELVAEHGDEDADLDFEFDEEETDSDDEAR